MNFKWVGPLALLAALVIGDQVRINRPGHKYRLTVEVETPAGDQIGVRRGVGASRPRLQPRRAHRDPRRCCLRRSRRRQEPGRSAGRISINRSTLDGINYLALRAYKAAGRSNVSFNEMNRLAGAVPVTGALIPVLLTFADPADPATARMRCRRTIWKRRSGKGVSSAWRFRRSGAERVVAARFRRAVGRACHARHRSEIAVAEPAQTAQQPLRCGPPDCRSAMESMPGRRLRENSIAALRHNLLIRLRRRA